MAKKIDHDIKIKAEDYAYLDKIDHAGWMWEFIRRSPDYVKCFTEFERSGPDVVFKYDRSSRSTEIENAPKEFLAAWHDLQAKFFIRPHFAYSHLMIKGKAVPIKFADKSAYLLIDKIGFRNLFCYAIPRPDKRYCDFSTRKPIIIGATALSTFTFEPEIDNGCSLEYLGRALKEKLTPSNLADTIYIGVSRFGGKTAIRNEINRILRELPDKEAYTHDNSWKSCIIIHDLHKHERLSYESIFNMLEAKFGIASGERTVGNHGKRAEQIISGGYKKFLNLPKL